MGFRDDYCKLKDKDKSENVDKTAIANESFALLEMLDVIAFKLGRKK